MSEPKNVGFLAAMKTHLCLPGQTAMQFAQELKPLSYDDKLWYHRALLEAGIACDPPAPPKPA